jgi:hypothetical protein
VDPLTIHNPPGFITAKTTAIYRTMLGQSSQMREGNFTVIGTDDLARLFRLYDDQFYGGWLTATVAARAAGPLIFRLSSTMTRAGGKTIRHHRNSPDGKPHDHYEIAVACRLLFMTFGDIQRPVVVCGLPCTDRLHALQRITEHEIIHLTELLVWGKSSCAAPRFKTLVQNIFGHPSTKHDLVTPRERAVVQHGVKVGDTVEFDFEGVRHVGRINRIHHRATVLVEASDGLRYSDGKTYKKFYVPLPMLRIVQGPTADPRM